MTKTNEWRHLTGAVWGLGFLISSTGTFAATSFFDGTFSPTDWDYSSKPAWGWATSEATQQAFGGNPGAYAHFDQWAGDGPTIIYHFAISEVFSYDPGAEGGVASLSASYDTITTYSQYGGNNSVNIVLRQGDKLYGTAPVSGGAGTVLSDWTSCSASALSEMDFAEFQLQNPYPVEPTLFQSSFTGDHPDFSADGAPLSIGYGIWLGAGLGGQSNDAGIDNFSVSVVSVPEPASLSPLVMIAVGVLARRRT